MRVVPGGGSTPRPEPVHDGFGRIAYRPARKPERKVYTCDHCGLVDYWREGWSWYGSIAGLEGMRGPAPIFACSEACADAVFPKGYRDQRMD